MCAKIFLIALTAFGLWLMFSANPAHACTPPAGGSYTITASCSFSGSVHGIDNGNLTINAGVTLTINANQTIAWNSGRTITVNGSIAMSASGVRLKQTNLWMLDADNDDCPANSTQFAQDTTPGTGYYRRYDVLNYTVIDYNDSVVGCTDPGGNGFRETTPYLFLPDGRGGFQIENDVLFGHPASFFRSRETGLAVYESGNVSNDLYVISGDAEKAMGDYVFQIREIEQEESHIDRVELKAVHHPKDAEVLASWLYGKYYVIKKDEIKAGLRPKELPFAIEPGNTVEVRVAPFDGKNAKLVLGTRAEIVAKESVQLEISYFDGAEWKLLAKPFGRLPLGAREIIELPQGVKDGRFKIFAQERMWITKFAVLTNVSPVGSFEESLLLKEASLFGKGDVKKAIEDKDFDYLYMKTGDVAELRFASEKRKPAGFSTSLIMELDGFYNALTPE